MARKNKNESTADRQPMETGELKKIVDTFMERYEQTENELQLLKEDQANLLEEFSDRIDMKTLKQAIRTINIKRKVNHVETYEQFMEILDKRTNV